MKRFWLLLALAVATAGCGDRATENDAASALRVGLRGLPPTLGNPFGANGPPSSYIWSALFDGLTRLDPDGDLVPALATAWERETPSAWIFELRKGVRFANGEPFDAQAVADVLAWLRGEEGRRSVIGNEVRGIDRVEILGTHSLRLHTTAPDAILPRRLTAVMIPAPGAWRELGPDAFAVSPIGTGPYRVTDWHEVSGQVVARRFHGSWRPATLPALRFIELSEPSVMTQALVSGDIDLGTIAFEAVGRLEGLGLEVSVSPSMQIMSIAFIVEGRDDSPLADRRVREALNLAVDRNAIAGDLLDGLVRPATQPASEVTPGHDASLGPIGYDPARARRLLEDAGYPGGFDLTVNVVTKSLPGDTLIYQAVEAYLEAVGVRAVFNIQPFPTWLKQYLRGSWSADAFGLSWNAAPYNDIQRPLEIFSCSKRRPFFCDPETDRLVSALRSAMKPGERAELLHRAAAHYRKVLPALFLIEQVDLFGHRCDLGGLHIANRVPRYEALALEPSACGERP